MPTTTLCGTPGAANEAIGGVPNIHYADVASKGRGQVIRLLCEDAGIAYNDTRYNLQTEFPEFKATQLREWNPLATIPVVELDGRILTQSYAILRHLARRLGRYDGASDDDKYWADAMCDVALDWRTQFVAAAYGAHPERDVPKYIAGPRAAFLQGLDAQLERHGGGPFVVGADVTYADLVIYQICHDEGLTRDGCAGLRGHARLAALCAAVEARPNVAAFLKSDRYRG